MACYTNLYSIIAMFFVSKKRILEKKELQKNKIKMIYGVCFRFHFSYIIHSKENDK